MSSCSIQAAFSDTKYQWHFKNKQSKHRNRNEGSVASWTLCISRWSI